MIRKTMVILQSTMEDKILGELNRDSTQVASQEYSAIDNLVQLIGLVLLLIIILIVAYYTSKFIGSIKLRQNSCSNFKVIDSYSINQNKLLQIVKIGSKYIVISISKDTVSFITELEETDIINKDNLELQQDKFNFKQIFDKVRKNKE